MLKSPITISGGLGFIGSNLVAHLNSKGITPFVITRNLDAKWRNVNGLQFHLVKEPPGCSSVVHLGANVDTTETMSQALWDNNVNYTVALQKATTKYGGKFIYASSASVYGAEEKDFSERIEGLKPLNAYGFTKLQLDTIFFGAKSKQVEDTYGLRFFNVYGPGEDYKGRMSSIIHKAFHKQNPVFFDNIRAGTKGLEKDGYWSLFASNRKEYKDGEQARDFVYVGDVCKVIEFFLSENRPVGVYNLGSGRATTFNDVVKAIDPVPQIAYREMSEDIRNQYQYYTCADLTKLRAIGYKDEFLTVAEGIEKMRTKS